jgi:outer membrane cobalamin receptor
MKKLFIFLFVFFLLIETALADNEVIKLDEIIVSATRTESSLYRISASSVIVSEAQINSSGANDLSDLFNTTNVVQTVDYGTGSLSTISMRGSSSSQVLVLVDGKRLNDSRNGMVNLDLIPISNIQRIEIIRGGQSAIYGADAVGGIVNIITKKPRNSSVKVSSNIGSYGLQSYGIEASKQIKSIGGLISLSRISSDSDFPYKNKFGEELIRKNADYAKRNVFTKLTWNILPSANFEISANHFYSDANTPGMIGFYTPNAKEKDKTNDFSLIFSHKLSPIAFYKITAYDRYAFMRYINPTYPYPSDDTHKTNTKNAEIQFNILSNTNYPLVMGALLLNEKVDSTAVNERNRQTYSGYAQQEIGKELDLKLKRISLFPAIRWDHYSDFDAGISPKIGVLASFEDIVYLRANIGKSYRAPTMSDLYWPSSAMTSGNPSLKPEKSNDGDFGIQLSLLNQLDNIRLRFGTSYFQNNITDGIQWTPTIGGKWTPNNIAKINTKGIEIDMMFHLSMLNIPDLFRINSNYTLTIAKDSLGNQLIYRPKHSIGYTVRIGTDSLWCQAKGLHQGRRFYTTANTKWLDPFTKYDFQIGIERRILKDTKTGLILELKNAFNADYQLSADYPMPGREWGFRLYFGMEGE